MFHKTPTPTFVIPTEAALRGEVEGPRVFRLLILLFIAKGVNFFKISAVERYNLTR